MMKQRITYLDTTKALLIALVVIGHVLQYANPEYNILPYTLAQAFIYSFHMSAFFLLSGLLFDTARWKARTWGTFLLRRTRTLLVPYLFFEALAALYKALILREITIPEGLYRMVTLRCNVGADWFLPALFLASVLFFALTRYTGKPVWIAAAVLCFCGLPFFPRGHWWGLCFRGLLGFAFMILGNVLRDLLTRCKGWYAAAAFLLTAASGAVCFRLGWANDFYDCVLKAPALFALSGVCGLYFMMAIARKLHEKWLQVIGENTLVIMGTHQLVLYTIPSNSGVLWIVGVLLLIAAVEAAVIYMTNRFCPALIGKPRKTA